MQHEKSLEFLQIAMKYLPEAKEQLEKSGIEALNGGHPAVYESIYNGNGGSL